MSHRIHPTISKGLGLWDIFDESLNTPNNFKASQGRRYDAVTDTPIGYTNLPQSSGLRVRVLHNFDFDSACVHRIVQDDYQH